MARILVVDDDRLVLAALAEILIDGNHEVISIDGHEDGMKQVLQPTYDLLLTDIFLPWISGWDLIKAVRRSRPDLPVIAISGGGMDVEADMALKIGERIGADFVLSKPVDADVLLTTVSKALKRRDPN